METLIARAQSLPYDFPTGTHAVQLARLPFEKQQEITKMAATVTPFCDEAFQDLLRGFLAHKRAHGSSVEQALYASMDDSDLFTRMLVKRPVSFWGPSDRYILTSTKQERQLYAHQWGGFEEIGGDQERAPLVLRDYLSYDEMQLSALISVAVPTLFINNGDRYSKCLPGEAGSFQDSGVIVACVGARLVKEGRMEAEHMVITHQCDAVHGYGPQAKGDGRRSAWMQFYGVDHFPSYEEAVAGEGNGRYHRIHCQCQQCRKSFMKIWTDQGGQYCEGCMRSYYRQPCEQPPDHPFYLDGLIYKRRIRATVEPFLEYASRIGVMHREENGSGAHVRVKGLGLGAWWVDPVQEVLMKQVYQEVIATKELVGIEVLDFVFFPTDDVPIGKVGLEVKATKCGFSEPVGDRLLVAMYAWDGNAYPGNEWWAEGGDGRYLGMTDDSAAASCSLITSLQHPVVNSERLCAAAAQMVTRNGMITEFSKGIQENI